jgi:SAM-dependent methyltransferase
MTTRTTAENQPPQDWWQSFYDGPFGEHQVRGLREELAVSDTDWIERTLGLEPGARVLDAPTGNGRIGLELARRGYRVTGLDFNARVLDEARRRAHIEALPYDVERADLRDFTRIAEFDQALCFWGSVGYFSEADELRFFKNVARALKPGGRFLLDTHVVESLARQFRTHDWTWFEASGQRTRVVEERHWNVELSRIESTWTFIDESGHSEERQVSIRIYTYKELCALLREAGFQSFDARVTASEAPFRLGAPRLGLVASRGDDESGLHRAPAGIDFEPSYR